MKVLVIDIGGTNVKSLATGHNEPRKFPSGPTLTPAAMVAGVKQLARDWEYEGISIGYPGVVLHQCVVTDPHNLAPGWIGFDFSAAFERPVKLINDAAMQALGGYRGGVLLFLGLGTGLGSALIVEGVVVPLELAHLSYKRRTYEDYLGVRAMTSFGKKRWRKEVALAVARLIDAFHPDDVVLGGGNVKKLKELPPHCRTGDNANAFLGGFRLWEEASRRKVFTPQPAQTERKIP